MPARPVAKFFLTVLMLASVVGIVLIGVLPKPSGDQLGPTRMAAWVGIMALLLIFAILAGRLVSGNWRGVLIDEVNRISLSRLQLLLWTVLILSAFLEAALSNVRLAGEEAPLSLGMPAEVWGLLGISTASLVGSPLILNNKKQPDPGTAHRARVEWSAVKGMDQAEAVPGQKAKVVGARIGNATPADATWGDMFRGDVVGSSLLDLAKVQMFFFTLILVLAYGVALANMFITTVEPKIASFPELDPGMVALLGISHTGYLVDKGVQEPPASPPPPGPECS
jgi:hypothetical protein